MEKVRSSGHTVTATLTRPNDTSAYAAGDVMADSTSAPTIPLTFLGVTIESPGNAVIQSLTLIDSANNATKPDLELWLFDTVPGVENDNAAFAPTDAETMTLVAVIPIPATMFVVGNAGSAAAGNAVCDIQNLGIPVNTNVTGRTTLWGFLVVRNAYTPVANEQFTVRLHIID